MRTLFLTLLWIPLSSLAEPVTLFDGKTLDGWDYDPAVWRVEDGCITGGSTTEKIPKNFFISTKRSFQNFELRMKIKCSGDPKTGMINSGIQIRSIRDGTAMSGYQVDCGAGWFGKIYDEHRRNKPIWVPTPEQQAALDKVVDVFGWNEYVIRAEGPRIQTWINGVLCIDYTEEDPNIALDGHIAPQVHSGGVCLVQVKDITIEELPPTPGAPTWESIGGLEGMKAKLPPKPKAKAKAKAAASTKRDISYNDVQGVALSAQDQLKKFKLPEGYQMELVVQESEGIGKFVSVYFDQRGRMWTQTALEYPVDANENPAAAEAVYAGKGKDKVLVYPRESLNAKIPAGGLTNPTVFADGLAIPLGILPWGAGDTCYVQHGHDLKLYKDTNGDGKADTFDVILTGFGVQDSHLFPHQFTRAPGGWIWMAQGLFNHSQVRQPGSDQVVDWPKCSMARMGPDGSEFEIISTGPNNIWGLVITGEGETFIQEANDYGYPVMPFHEYAYYPGGMEALKKSYQPDFPPQADFRMGGTGLSGLALIESGPLSPREATAHSESAPHYVMAVANPIISKIQTLAMHRESSHHSPSDGPRHSESDGHQYWKLEQLPDLITCDDPFFRPVALTNGPDGCIYIVDWYNKIISHNEVPRAHPDRDKTRGRIWRIKSSHHSPSDVPSHHSESDDDSIPDFTHLTPEDLINMLGTEPVGRAHLAWQTFADRKDTSPGASEILHQTITSSSAPVARRIQSHWATYEQDDEPSYETHLKLAHDSNPLIRQACIPLFRWSAGELADDLGNLATDPTPDVRRTLATYLGKRFHEYGDPDNNIPLATLLAFAKPSLTDGPTTQSSRAPKQIPVREAYDREFERFLVRMFLERHPDVVAKFLDSEAAAKLPVEARVLASLALEPKASASRVAKLLPQLDRAPNDEELLRLAQFPAEPGVGEALQSLLTNGKSRAAVAEKLIAQRTKLDAKQIAPLLESAARAMLAGVQSLVDSGDDPERLKAGHQQGALALQLISGFQLTSLEIDLVTLARSDGFQPSQMTAGSEGLPKATRHSLLNTLRDLRSAEADLFASIAQSDPDPLTREAALEALAASRAPDAGTKLLALYPSLPPAQQRNALNALSSSKAGAKTIVTALLDQKLPQTDLDGPTVERLATVLGADPALEKLQQQLGGIFREVLLLDGSNDAWVDSKITLDGPFTVEAWVRLAPGIGNEDCILGTPNGIQLNFFQSKLRVYAGSELHDVCVATKPMTPDLWTHVAVTRDEQGICRIYQNGELDATGPKPAPAKWENCRIGWSGPAKGTEGAIMEFRVRDHARSAEEIRVNFDRSDPSNQTDLSDLAKLGKGARLAKAIDTPPLLTAEQAAALDAKFARYLELSRRPANLENGKILSALCIACHQIGNEGGQIGPNLSGAGAMGLEAVLRNILTPNAAMEPGYRVFRVELKNGDLIDAFFVSEDDKAVVIRQVGAPDRRIDKTEISRTQYLRRSLMPEGLLDALSDEQAADLLGYLMSLK